MTQKDIYDYLKSNPLNVAVHVGSLEEMNGKDYIFLDFTTDELIGSDDKGEYQTAIQMTVATKDWKTRIQLVRFIMEKFNVSVTYETSREFQYYLAKCNTSVILYG